MLGIRTVGSVTSRSLVRLQPASMACRTAGSLLRPSLITPSLLRPSLPAKTVLTPTSLLLSRKLHVSRTLRFHQSTVSRSSFFNSGREPPRSPFTVYRLPVAGLLIGSFMFLTLFFMLIPLLFQLFLPLVLGAVAVYQFRAWRSNTFYKEVMARLPQSSIRISYKTLNALQYRFFPSPFIQEFKISTEDADAMMGMVQTRVIEAFNKNEQGVGAHFFAGEGNVKQFDDVLQLDIMKSRTFGRKIDQNFVMSMQYPLMYVEGAAQKHFADVLITILDDSFLKQQQFQTIFELARTEGSCRMVISVQSLSRLLPHQYIISTPGETGSFYGKYKVRTASDGHREFTIEKNE